MKITRFLLQSMVIELSLCRTFPKCFKSLTNGKGNSFNKIGVISLYTRLVQMVTKYPRPVQEVTIYLTVKLYLTYFNCKHQASRR